MLRPDMYFSYWMFGWYLLYISKIVKSNPKLAFIIGVIINLWILGIIIYDGIMAIDIFLFVVALFIIKIVPLWTIWSVPIQRRDIYALLIIIVMYESWVIVNGYTPQDQINWYFSFGSGKLETPFISLVHKYWLQDRL